MILFLGKISLIPVFSIAAIYLLLLIGCGSSTVLLDDTEWADYWIEETESSGSLNNHEIERLRRENERLRSDLEHQITENRVLNSRITELERLLSKRVDIFEAPGDGINAAEEEPRIHIPEPAQSYQTLSRVEFDREYTRAVNLFMDREYEAAREIFKRLLSSGTDHPLIINCRYWTGETYFGTGDYARAIEEFRKVLEIPGGSKQDDAQIMIANSYFSMGYRELARREYQRLIDNYPDSGYAAIARQRLRNL